MARKKLLLAILIIAIGTWFALPVYFVLQTSVLRTFVVVSPLTVLRHASLGTWRLVPWARLAGWLKTSLIVCVSVSLGLTLTCALAGYGFACFDFRGKEQLFWLFLLAMVVPSALLFLPKYLIVRDLRLLDSYWVLIIPLLLSPSAVFLSRQYFLGLSKELLDAARIDGASELGIFRHIVLPLSKPLLVLILITGFGLAWGDFMWQYLVTRRAEIQTMTVGLGLYTMGLIQVDSTLGELGSLLRLGASAESLGAAIAILQSLPTFLLFAFGQKHFLEGLRIGAPE